jgi:magnesium and cobalt transporter
LARLFGATPQDTTDSVNGTAPDKGVPNGTGTRAVGLSNLRRLRVEDVAIPRAEIVSVPCDISPAGASGDLPQQRADAASGL